MATVKPTPPVARAAKTSVLLTANSAKLLSARTKVPALVALARWPAANEAYPLAAFSLLPGTVAAIPAALFELPPAIVLPPPLATLVSPPPTVLPRCSRC